jgi:hypothetical protein
LHAVTYDILKIKNKYAVAVLNLQYINWIVNKMLIMLS